MEGGLILYLFLNRMLPKLLNLLIPNSINFLKIMIHTSTPKKEKFKTFLTKLAMKRKVKKFRKVSGETREEGDLVVRNFRGNIRASLQVSIKSRNCSGWS